MEVLCIGTAVMDILASPIGNSNKWKEKQRIEQITMRAGGDATNQAMALAKDDVNVALCASIGIDSNGVSLKNLVRETGVDASYMVQTVRYPTGTSLVLVDEKGKRNTFSVKGAHSILRKNALPDLEKLQGERPRIISIGSLFSLPDLEEDGLLEYIREAKEKYGILIFADLSSDKYQQGLNGIRRFLPYIDYFLPSVYDATEMTHTRTARDAARVYLKAGCKNVIIKCGADGAFLCNARMEKSIPCIKVKAVNTTGAGDRMVAYFIEEILNETDIEEACRIACERASQSVSEM